jgi:hypothetical protein
MLLPVAVRLRNRVGVTGVIGVGRQTIAGCCSSSRASGIYFLALKGQFTTTVSIGDSAAAPAGVRMRKRLPSGLGT